MNCPNCGKVLQGGKNTCPWCGVLISNLDAGIVASPGKRLAGYILDVVVWGVIWVIITIMIVGGFESSSAGTAVLGILLLLVAVIYYFILLSKGKSYGKWILGMRAYRTSGKPAGFLIMLIRETIGKFISGLILSLGYLWLLWDQDRQTWHDKIVGTVVMVPNAKINRNVSETESM